MYGHFLNNPRPPQLNGPSGSLRCSNLIGAASFYEDSTHCVGSDSPRLKHPAQLLRYSPIQTGSNTRKTRSAFS